VNYPRFIVDGMLGNIAKKLRIMGFDTEFWLTSNDDFLINKCMNEPKLLVTRDRGLYLKISKMGKKCLLLLDNDEVRDLVFILEDCDIKYVEPVPNVNTRCTICNGILNKIDKTMVSNPIPEKVYKSISNVYRCSKCSKIYWEGTHVQKINLFIGNINNLLRKRK
jgi:uncharacterized protein